MQQQKQPFFHRGVQFGGIRKSVRLHLALYESNAIDRGDCKLVLGHPSYGSRTEAQSKTNNKKPAREASKKQEDEAPRHNNKNKKGRQKRGEQKQRRRNKATESKPKNNNRGRQERGEQKQRRRNNQKQTKQASMRRVQDALWPIQV